MNIFVLWLRALRIGTQDALDTRARIAADAKRGIHESMRARLRR